MKPRGEPGEEDHSAAELGATGIYAVVPRAELDVKEPSTAELDTHDPDTAKFDEKDLGTGPPYEIDSDPRQNLTPLELPAEIANATAAPTSTLPLEIAPSTTSPVRDTAGVILVPAEPTPVTQTPPPQEPIPRPSALPNFTQAARPDVGTLEALRARQADLERERQRLLRLQEIEQEQARLEQQISQFGSSSGKFSPPR
ncbi:hypothetical protein B0H63DRAFT_522529 [Podospora didyma]|uniref:Uncharacterized protein n=1 Tax=Podospora didyma TaxID=330526 RepID=A0AAE0NPM8_9PEZI|nr:hypothetical protein B0H63DRAFT_522529 [Podospora didyma]